MENRFSVRPMGGLNIGQRMQQTIGEGLNAMQRRNQEQEQQSLRDEVLKKAQSMLADPRTTEQEMAEMSLKYPELGKRMYEAVGKRDAAEQKRVTDRKLSLLSANDFYSELKKQEQDGISLGRDMSDTTSIINAIDNKQLSVDDAKKTIRKTLAATAPQSLIDYDKVMQTQQVKPMTEYQQNQTRQRQQEIDLKREENKLKAEERRLKQETNELKKQQLEKDIEERKQNISQKKTDDMKRIDSGILKAEDGIKTVDEFLSNQDYIDSMTGYRGRAPALTDSGVEAEAYFENIKNSMTLENLGVMSGPLTDKDIAIIASASSRLRAGMGETAMRKELNTIKEAYQRVIKNFNKEKSDKGYKAKELSDEELLNKYG